MITKFVKLLFLLLPAIGLFLTVLVHAGMHVGADRLRNCTRSTRVPDNSTCLHRADVVGTDDSAEPFVKALYF